MRRRFSKKERTALFLAADGRSEISGTILNDWHADHIIPWSKGGETDVSNGQAISAEENLKKSDHFLDLLPWQQEFFILFQQHGKTDLSLAGLPGCGKTRGSLAPASMWLQGSNNRKLAIVVPTKIVRKQWRDVAKKYYGIELESENFFGNIKADYNGFVTTYSSVASDPFVFRRLCAKHEILAIFDEIHHAGDKRTWGTAISNAFEGARRRLCLSGTPFRHDDQKIPFLTIGRDGFYEMDFKYDYPRALREGVIREVAFHHYAGSVELAYGEQIYKFHTDDDLEDDDVSRRLVALLRSPTFTRGLLREAHEKLLYIRRAKPDAAALALAIDANHAAAIAKLLEEVTGEAPDILVSDSDIATVPDVERFKRDTSKKWIVAVRMVSEGVDIQKLMVLAYLTNTATELFFRQAVGRIVRSQRTDADTEAYCFMPDDPRLRTYATSIEEFQNQIIAEEEDDEQRQRELNADIERRFMQILNSSEAELSRLTLRGKGHQDDAANIKNVANEFGMTESEVASIISRFAGIHQPKQESITKEERMVQLRRNCNRLTNKVANKRGVEPKDIHKEYMKIANIAQPEMTEAQLEAKRLWLLRQL